MASFQTSLGYELYLKIVTNPEAALPSSTTGMTKIGSLRNSPFEGTTDTTSAVTYDSEGGYAKAVATGASYTIPLEVQLDQLDAGYQLIKEAADDAVEGKYVQWYRKSPIPPGAKGNTGAAGEIYKGVGFITGFSETIDAGGISAFSCTITGYGAPVYVPAVAGTTP